MFYIFISTHVLMKCISEHFACFIFCFFFSFHFSSIDYHYFQTFRFTSNISSAELCMDDEFYFHFATSYALKRVRILNRTKCTAQLTISHNATYNTILLAILSFGRGGRVALVARSAMVAQGFILAENDGTLPLSNDYTHTFHSFR